MPGLKGVTNFLVGNLRIGVPLIGIGVENLAPDIGTTPGSNEVPRTAGLGSLVGVEATGWKRDDVLWGFPEFLSANGLWSGDLKDFIGALPSTPDGVWRGRLPSAVGVEKKVAERNADPALTWPVPGVLTMV
jgi:hypothetical protein